MRGIAVLVGFQVLGEGVAWASGLSLPGSVAGLLLLTIALAVFGQRLADTVQQASDKLLGYIALLLIPVGAGIMTLYPVLAKDFWPIVAAIVISTVTGLAATALTLSWLTARRSS